MKLSKQQSKLHLQAVEMLQQATLNSEEKEFVLDNWREDAVHMNGLGGAFFTPRGLARDLSQEVAGKVIVDLCAGIGSLAYAVHLAEPWRRIYCVELNPDYVEVGRKIVPDAQWICMDVFDYCEEGTYLQLSGEDKFNCAISNPPFGNVKTHKNKHGKFEYDLIEAASRIATDGVFIIPQMSCPFRYSGRKCYETYENSRYSKFSRETGIHLSMNCGFDTSEYSDEWTTAPPTLEIALGFRHED